MRVVLGGWRLLSRSLRRVMGAGTRLLSEETLEDGVCRTVGRYMSLFVTEGSSVVGGNLFGGEEDGESPLHPHSLG